jgi:hypothetical protein
MEMGRQILLSYIRFSRKSDLYTFFVELLMFFDDYANPRARGGLTPLMMAARAGGQSRQFRAFVVPFRHERVRFFPQAIDFASQQCTWVTIRELLQRGSLPRWHCC